MEKIKCICVMRDLFQALAQLENSLLSGYGLTLNEAMVLCSIAGETVTAGAIAECTGLTSSHASKVIRAAERKGLLVRSLGEQDKRQMCFALSEAGEDRLRHIREQGVDVPDLLRSFFE